MSYHESGLILKDSAQNLQTKSKKQETLLFREKREWDPKRATSGGRNFQQGRVYVNVEKQYHWGEACFKDTFPRKETKETRGTRLSPAQKDVDVDC